MYGRGFPRNPYGHAAPFKGGEINFKPPRPMYQSSPNHNGANGHGSTPPYGGIQGKYPSPNYRPNVKSPPHFMQSPPHYMQSPPHGFDYQAKSPRPRFEYTRSPRGSPGGRGAFKNGSGRGRGSPKYQQSPRTDIDHNPGGSNDISIYYNHNMVEDPWRNLAPVPVTKKTVTTT